MVDDVEDNVADADDVLELSNSVVDETDEGVPAESVVEVDEDSDNEDDDDSEALAEVLGGHGIGIPNRPKQPFAVVDEVLAMVVDSADATVVEPDDEDETKLPELTEDGDTFEKLEEELNVDVELVDPEMAEDEVADTRVLLLLLESADVGGSEEIEDDVVEELTSDMVTLTLPVGVVGGDEVPNGSVTPSER